MLNCLVLYGEVFLKFCPLQLQFLGHFATKLQDFNPLQSFHKAAKIGAGHFAHLSCLVFLSCFGTFEKSETVAVANSAGDNSWAASLVLNLSRASHRAPTIIMTCKQKGRRLGVSSHKCAGKSLSVIQLSPATINTAWGGGTRKGGRSLTYHLHGRKCADTETGSGWTWHSFCVIVCTVCSCTSIEFKIFREYLII